MDHSGPVDALIGIYYWGNEKTKPFFNKHKGNPFLLQQVFGEGKLNHSATCRKKEGMEDERNPHKC